MFPVPGGFERGLEGVMMAVMNLAEYNSLSAINVFFYLVALAVGLIKVRLALNSIKWKQPKVTDEQRLRECQANP